MGRNRFSGWILESWEGRERAMGKTNQGGRQGLCAQTSGRPRRRAGGEVAGASESLRMTECRIPTGGVKTCSPVLASFLAVFTPQFSITHCQIKVHLSNSRETENRTITHCWILRSFMPREALGFHKRLNCVVVQGGSHAHRLWSQILKGCFLPLFFEQCELWKFLNPPSPYYPQL